MKPHKLRLYVTGRTGHSLRAIRNLEAICEARLKGHYEIEVIDVLENPQLAENEKVLATPTLIKELPLPIRKIVGDLSQKQKVLLGLDLVSATENGEEGR